MNSCAGGNGKLMKGNDLNALTFTILDIILTKYQSLKAHP